MAVTNAASAAPSQRKFHWRDVWDDPRIVQMLALGFSSGLPLLLVLSTFTTRLAFADIDIRAIGLFSYVALPYSLKFIWAPMIDRVDVPVLAPRLGRRRAWMIATQIATAVCLLLMAFSDPRDSLALLGLGAFLVAFCAATQDIVIDGWRIEAAGTDLQGVLAATSNLGYRFGIIVAGAGALYIAAAGGWTLAYLVMAAFMGIGIVAALFADPYDAERRVETAGATRTDRLAAAWNAIAEPLAALFQRMGHALWAILLLVALYRLPDFVSGVMANPLYRTLGYDLATIATITKLFGVWVGIFGGFAGGWAMTRLGLFPTMLIGASLAASSHLSLAWLSTGGPEMWRLTVAISIENFCGSFAGIALIAYMSSLTTPGHAGFQYALFSSLYALPGKLVAGASGFIVAAYGYPVFFVMTAAIGIPVVLLCLAVGRIPGNSAGPAASAGPVAEDGNHPAAGELASSDLSAIPARART